MKWLLKFFRRKHKHVPMTEKQQRFLNGHIDDIHKAIKSSVTVRVVRPSDTKYNHYDIDSAGNTIVHAYPSDEPSYMPTPTDFSFDTPSYDSGSSCDSSSGTDLGGGDFGGGGASSDF